MQLLAERRASETAPPAERGPLPPDQVAVPAEQRFWTHREAPPLVARHAAAQGGQEQAVTRPPPCPLDVPTQDADFVPERQQFNGLRPTRRRAEDDELEQQADDRVQQGEQHTASQPTAGPCSWPIESSAPTR
jgi:hypothetical protein